MKKTLIHQLIAIVMIGITIFTICGIAKKIKLNNELEKRKIVSDIVNEFRDVALEAVKKYKNSAENSLREKTIIRSLKEEQPKIDVWYNEEKQKIDDNVTELLGRLAEKEIKWREQFGLFNEEK